MEGSEKTENEASTSAATTTATTALYSGENAKRARLNSTLAAMLQDPILSNVPKHPALSDVDTLISLELGAAMRISVLKLDSTSLLGILTNTLCAFGYYFEVTKFKTFADVVVMNTANVKDLKVVIMKKVNEMEQSKMGHRHISWKHVWANYCVLYHNEKLLDERALLQDFGIRNNSQVQFVPFVAARQSQKHTRRKKHRFFHGLNKLS